MSATPAAAALRPPLIRVRWRIFALLFGLGLMAYVQQRSITVASYQMMPELGLSQMQIGWLEWALLLGYAAVQFPGGMLGQRLGARVAFTLISTVALLAMLATPLAPSLLTGAALFAALLLLQGVLGAAQAPIFPVSAGVFESWFPPLQWPLVQGVQSMGLQLGAALAPPLVAGLMSAFGWRPALFWSSLPALALIGLWCWYGRNSPKQHPSVGAAELAEAPPQPGHAAAQLTRRDLRKLLRNRDVLALTGSYLCFNYVFYLLANWVFLYLVQERGFTMLAGGWLAALPPLAAALGAGGGGWLASRLLERHGPRWGLHIVPLTSLPTAAALLLVAVHTSHPYLAVAALALCFACVEVNEGPYWAATMYAARHETMAATGILNTGGNIGGLVATPIVAYLSGHHAWVSAFVLGAALTAASAAAWLLVNPARS